MNQMTPTISASAQKAPTTRRKPGWVLLLLSLPYLGLCFPALYSRPTPALLGFPFFYWYQLAWVVLTSCLLGIVYLKLRQPE